MPKYRALRTTLVSHLSIVVEEGQEFEATFPEGMQLGDNLELVKPVKGGAKGEAKGDAKGGDGESLT
jgi:hypothetical protein